MNHKFDAVIFDMDGTLIEPLLDFQAIRAELGISTADGILEAIEKMPAGDAVQAHQVLLSHELAAAARAKLMPGAIELLTDIRLAGLTTALLTRNAAGPMRIVLDKFFTGDTAFDITWSREDGPIKPEPDGVLKACDQLGVTVQRVCCVGDFYYDIAAANNAGATSVLLDRTAKCDFADQADYVIRNLQEMRGVLGI